MNFKNYLPIFGTLIIIAMSGCQILQENLKNISLNAAAESDNATVAQGQNSNSLIAQYSFENEGDIIVDGTGNWSGILKNNSEGFGQIDNGFKGQGLLLSGSNYVELDTIISNHSATGSLDLFFKLESKSSAIMPIFGNRGARLNLILSNGQLCFQKNHDNQHKYICADVNLEVDTWYEAGISWGSQGMKLFLNKELIAHNQDDSDYQTAISTSFPVNYYTMAIGHKAWCCMEGIGIYDREGEYFFTGMIDEIKIYSTEK